MNTLSLETLTLKVPSIFANQASPKVSDKYTFVSSLEILEKFEQDGWKIASAVQKGKTQYHAHEIRLTNGTLPAVGDSLIQAVIQNSHNGTKPLQIQAGLFRLVCSNGLVVADEEFSAFRIRHTGYTFQELRGVVSQAVADLPKKVLILNQMQLIELTPVEQRQLAIDAMQLRTNRIDAKWDEETIADVLTPQRDADKGNDLWTVFNVIQEKITQGGYSAALNGAKVRKVRKIKSFEKDLKVNQDLFKLAVALVN